MNLFSLTARGVSRLVGHKTAADRRVARRWPRRLLVELSGLELYSTNINVCGLQLTCPLLWYPHLCAGWNTRAVEVDIHLSEKERVRALCEVVYLYDYDDEYLVGLRFKAFEKDASQRWHAYVSHVATTAERQAVRL